MAFAGATCCDARGGFGLASPSSSSAMMVKMQMIGDRDREITSTSALTPKTTWLPGTEQNHKIPRAHSHSAVAHNTIHNAVQRECTYTASALSYSKGPPIHVMSDRRKIAGTHQHENKRSYRL